MRFRAVDLDVMKPVATVVEEHVLRPGDEPTGECQRVAESIHCLDGGPWFPFGLHSAHVVVIGDLRDHDVTCDRLALARLDWGLIASHVLRLASIRLTTPR
jgi:hypothetical protein